jgi:hypothetical protein
LRGELPVSGAVKIPLGEDLRAVWSEATETFDAKPACALSPQSRAHENLKLTTLLSGLERSEKKMTTPAVFPESPSSTGSSGARSTNQNFIAL